MHTSQQVNKAKFFSRASSRQRLTAVVICLVVAGFFVFFALAGHYNIDMGRWLGYCGFKQKHGLPCPTCGMTTATLSFSHGKISEAFYIQPACTLLCCVLVLIAFLAFVTAVFGKHFHFIERFFNEVKVRYIILALIVIIAAGWAVTLARSLTASNSYR
jgi:hypothetical protein